MSLIKLTFSPEMAYAALVGQKCCTSRDDVKGNPGDEFAIGGVRFRLLAVVSMQAREISLDLYRAEGFDCIDDCAAALQTIYPNVGGYDWLNVHFFARCP